MGFTFIFILKDGWRRVKPWLEKVWSKRPGGLKKRSLLMCDQFKAHVTESTKRLATELKTHLAVIPGGLTSQLQPLDISVNKPFKGFMHEEWTKWIEAPTHHITPTGRVKWPSISNICEWVKNSWQRVKSETIVKSYKKSWCVLWSEKYSNLHSCSEVPTNTNIILLCTQSAHTWQSVLAWSEVMCSNDFPCFTQHCHTFCSCSYIPNAQHH